MSGFTLQKRGETCTWENLLYIGFKRKEVKGRIHHIFFPLWLKKIIKTLITILRKGNGEDAPRTWSSRRQDISCLLLAVALTIYATFFSFCKYNLNLWEYDFVFWTFLSMYLFVYCVLVAFAIHTIDIYVRTCPYSPSLAL